MLSWDSFPLLLLEVAEAGEGEQEPAGPMESGPGPALRRVWGLSLHLEKVQDSQSAAFPKAAIK